MNIKAFILSHISVNDTSFFIWRLFHKHVVHFAFFLNTEYHLGQLKAKIAKLRTQLLEPPKVSNWYSFLNGDLLIIMMYIFMFLFHDKQGSSGAGEGFEVTKYGHGRVALIGFPRSVIRTYLIPSFPPTETNVLIFFFLIQCGKVNTVDHVNRDTFRSCIIWVYNINLYSWDYSLQWYQNSVAWSSWNHWRSLRREGAW